MTILTRDLRPNAAILIGGSLAIALVSALSLPAPAALASSVLGVLMVAGADVDARTYLLPDAVTYGAVICGIAAAAALTQGFGSPFEPWFAAGDAVLCAANVGGNSDVVASVCGQVAGAHYGVSAIPPAWRNGLMQQDLIEGYADRLLAHGLVSLSS